MLFFYVTQYILFVLPVLTLLLHNSHTQGKRGGGAGLDAEREMRWNNHAGKQKICLTFISSYLSQ